MGWDLTQCDMLPLVVDFCKGNFGILGFVLDGFSVEINKNVGIIVNYHLNYNFSQ